jgi:hypothetical protein
MDDGALVAGNNFCITIGILLANVGGYSTQNRNDTGSYSISIAVQFLWATFSELASFSSRKVRCILSKRAGSSTRQKRCLLSAVKTSIRHTFRRTCGDHRKPGVRAAYDSATGYFGSWAICFKGSLFRGNSNTRRSVVGMCRHWSPS